MNRILFLIVQSVLLLQLLSCKIDGISSSDSNQFLEGNGRLQTFQIVLNTVRIQLLDGSGLVMPNHHTQGLLCVDRLSLCETIENTLSGSGDYVTNEDGDLLQTNGSCISASNCQYDRSHLFEVIVPANGISISEIERSFSYIDANGQVYQGVSFSATRSVSDLNVFDLTVTAMLASNVRAISNRDESERSFYAKSDSAEVKSSNSNSSNVIEER